MYIYICISIGPLAAASIESYQRADSMCVCIGPLAAASIESYQRADSMCVCIGPLAAASIESYQRAYPHMIRLHMVNEMERSFRY